MALTADQLLSNNMSTVDGALSQARMTNSQIRFSQSSVNVGRHSLGYNFNKPNIDKPNLSLNDLLPDGMDDDYLKWIDNEAEKWIDKYFPALNKCLRTVPEDWLCKVIKGTDPYGDSEKIFRAVWNQARDNAYATADITKNQLAADFSSRGFQLPSGAFASLMLEAENIAANSVAQANKEIMINEINVKLDLLKFAVEQAINLKIAIIRSLGDFYQHWMQLPNYGLEIAKAKADVMRAFYSALSEYWNVELGFERLKLQSAEAQLDANYKYEALKIDAFRPDTSYNPAKARAVEAFAQVAASASNANSMLIATLETSGNP